MTYPTSLHLGRWTRYTFLGWLLGIVLILILSSLFDVIGLSGFQFFIGIGIGSGIGFFQYRYFRKTGGPGIIWFWYSVIGLGLPFLLTDVIFRFVEIPSITYYLPISVVLGAIFISVLQFLILQSKSTNAGLWIVGGLVSWILAMATVLSMDYLKSIIHNRWAAFSINLMLILGGGVVLGLTSGLFLRKIFAGAAVRK